MVNKSLDLHPVQYEQNGEYFLMPFEMFEIRYRQSVEILVNLLSRLNDVDVVVSERPSKDYTDITVKHVPTGGVVKAGVANDLLVDKLKVTQKYQYETPAYAMQRYYCGIKSSLKQVIVDTQGKTRLFNPHRQWIDYEL